MQDDGLSESEGEGYFASVSDLMVGVLFVFLLMLTVFALNFRDDSITLDATKAQVEIARREADAAKAVATQLRAQNEMIYARLREAAIALQRELRDRESVRAALLQRLAAGLQANGIKFELDQQSGVLRLSDAVPFATGSSALSDPVAQHTVAVLAHVLAEVLPCFARAGAPTDCQSGDTPILETLLVEGHTDHQQYAMLTPTQSEAENDRLSTERALTVFAAIRQSQPTLDALKNPAGQPLLGVSGYGQRRPLPGADSSTEADLTRNRRIDLRFVLSSRNSDELERLLKDINAIHRQGTP